MSQGWGFTLLPPFRLQLRAGNGPPDPSREVPLLGTGATAGAATSGSGRTVLPSVRPLGSSPLGPSRRPAALAPQLPPSDVGRPGRAAGRMPDWVAPGAALAAATARALAVRHGPSDPDDGSSKDDDDSAGPAAASSGPQDPCSVLPRPVRAGGMLPVGRALAAPPARAPAATPTAPQHPNDPAAGTDAEEGRAAGACSHPVPAIDVGRPGRAVGMLPVPVVPGAAQAADTARALAAAYGLDSHAAVTSDDADAQYDRAALPAADKTPRM
ncbi:hypothetical protein PF010_g11914 [Phytophthora fragariae]|uniref:Uncharacterized protein n=1 Tax=Phytophthora fragariae TaxID=53985 RepID=A0A6G0P827_9STRA|nr:hypothetical protein PF010_g11914 [Phytophthora fragariae]KAE9239269.1 hypothetical protein PF004_g8013 [Phytophthora fragariae]